MVAAALALGAAPALSQGAEPFYRPILNLNGVTGHIDTPSARSQPDGQYSATVSYFGGTLRNTLTFQLTERLEGSFRYSGSFGLEFNGFTDYWDRSFDISLRLLDEGRYRPAVKIGLQDFVGTGVFASEYIVATKTLPRGVTVSAGLGWGRLGSYGSIGAPFGDRPGSDGGRGGELTANQWFKGPAAPFAALSWDVNPRLTLDLEYSSDAYTVETGGGLRSSTSTAIMTRRSPINLGATYRLGRRTELAAYYLYGSEFGVRLTFSLNPNDPPGTAFFPEAAPTAFAARPDRSTTPEAYATDWVVTENAATTLIAQLEQRLNPDGLTVDGLAFDGNSVDVRIRNTRYWSGAQAIGRTARALSWVMPASVETFRITPVENGIGASTLVVRRSDLEALELAPDGTAQLRAVAGLEDAARRAPGTVVNPNEIPKLTYNIGPYFKTSYFDPDAPIRYQTGIRLRGTYEPTPGLVFSGSLAQKVAGTIADSIRFNSTRLPPVRSNFVLYERADQPALEHLTANYFFRPGRDLYGRMSLGYLERMFGGAQAEVLWKPPESRLALGADLAWVKQRDYFGQFEFLDYEVITGHVSAYYNFDNGFDVQVDAGRYLAGDYGATLTVARTFNNGWRAGAFATLTDVPFEDFGEGSFDKGIFFEIPYAWALGTPTKQRARQTLRPTQRDGGARLDSQYRLFDVVKDYHRDGLDDSWGRVFR